MTTSVPFDTLKFVETLEAGGFTHAQAKAAAQAFADATGQELGTKRDLKEVETRLEAKIDRVEASIRELELRMTIKLGGLMIAATGVILAAIRYLPVGHS